MERALMGAALRGITVCVASGDQPEVHYPASSPHVFACGGTSLRWADGQPVDERPWSSSGGGLSRLFPRPKWQKEIQPPPAKGGGRAGRAVPDFSAHADPTNGYRIFVDGRWALLGGTTASAALWAGLIALLNEAVGRPHALIHEDLYKYFGPAGVLRNIPAVEAGGGRASDKPESGWTPVAGWGSPDGDRLVTSIRLRALFRAGAKE
jgi:kumamolisin